MAFALRNPRTGTASPPVEEERAREAEGVAEPHGAVTERRAARPRRRRIVAARGALALSSLLLTIARLVRLVVSMAVLLIVSAIVLRVLGANGTNTIVRDIHDAGRALVGPFHNVFSIRNPKVSIAVNWGLAAIVYLIVGGFVARLIARAAPRSMARAEPVV
jgi:hypothetical protein